MTLKINDVIDQIEIRWTSKDVIHAFHCHFKLVTSLLLYEHPLFSSQTEEPKSNLSRREKITENPSWLP